jgi:hypothetical protein
MLRPIFAFLFLIGLISNASPAVAAVEAEISGSETVATPVVVGADASEMVPDAPTSSPLPSNVILQNTVQLSPAPQPTLGPVLANNQGETSVQIINAEAVEPSDASKRIALTPMVGTSSWMGRWTPHITNEYTVGLIMEVPVTRNFSFEAEGSYARHGISYSLYSHSFDLYGLGGNGKLYLARGVVSPYLGAGVMGLYFDNMSRGPSFPQVYDHWLGSGLPSVCAGRTCVPYSTSRRRTITGSIRARGMRKPRPSTRRSCV